MDSRNLFLFHANEKNRPRKFISSLASAILGFIPSRGEGEKVHAPHTRERCAIEIIERIRCGMGSRPRSKRIGSQCQGRPDIIKIIATSRNALYEVVIQLHAETPFSRGFMFADIYIYPNATQYCEDDI